MAGPPSAPTEVFGAQDERAVLVCWRASVPDGAPVTGYTVTATPGGRSETVTADRSSCFLDGLTNDVEYFFTVTAHSAAGDSPTAISLFGATPSADEDDDELTWDEENDIPGIRQRIRSMVGSDRWGIHHTDQPARHLTMRVKGLTAAEREGLLAALGPQRNFVSIESTTVSLLELDRALEAVRDVVLATPASDAFVSSEQDPTSQTILVTTTSDAAELERALRTAVNGDLLSFTKVSRRWAMHLDPDNGPGSGQPS